MSLGAYAVAARLAHRALVLCGSGSTGRGGKVAAALAGRRAAAGRWLAWAAERPAGSLVWVHAASVGEALTALPVLDRLRALAANPCCILTYSSPSLEHWPALGGVTRADYVPLDEPAFVEPVLAALRPSLLVFSRADLWPGLVAAATARRVPLAIIGASVRPSSRRLSWPVRPLLRQVYTSLQFVGAVSAADAGRLARLGAAEAAIEVTGDPRHDYVLDRPVNLGAIRPLSEWAGNDPVLVAGSTHPSDDAVLFPAFARVLRRHHGARLLLVPHEPRRAAVEAAGVRAVVCTDGLAPDREARCVIIDWLGVLADLYALAALCYVGGGFDGAGVHAVIEPARFGVPVLFGPRWARSADASRLLEARAAVALPARQPQLALERQWRGWLDEPAARMAAGQRARQTLSPGAATVTARALCRLMAQGDGCTRRT